MRILRTVLYIILALLGIFIILALVAPNDAKVERSVDINAPTSLVYENINSLEDMTSWSPWTKVDPDAENKYTGESGTVGSEYYWSGNDSIGEGTQTITAIEEGKSVNTKLNFIRPWPGEADANVVLEANEDGTTKAIWNFSSHTPFPMNISNLFIDMDDMLGPSYAEGLASLKTMTEAQMNGMKIKGMNVKIAQIETRHYLGVRDDINISDMDKFYAVNMAKVGGTFARLGQLQDAVPSSLYYKWDEENQRTDLLAGMYTTKDLGEVSGMDKVEIPAGSAIIVEYYGNYEKTKDAHEAIDEFMNLTGRKFKDVAIEDYIVGPADESDPAKWLTKVIYPIEG